MQSSSQLTKFQIVPLGLKIKNQAEIATSATTALKETILLLELGSLRPVRTQKKRMPLRTSISQTENSTTSK
jgi:hypothetical protein